MHVLFFKDVAPMNTQVITALEISIHQSPIRICMTATKRVQFVVNNAVPVSVVIRDCPILRRRCVVRSATDQSDAHSEKGAR